MGSSWESTQFSPGWGCLLCLQAQLKEQNPLHSKAQESPAEAARGGRGQQGTGWDRSRIPRIQPGQGRCHSQEQQTGRTSWHQQWCWEEEGMSPGIFPDAAEPRAGGDGLRSIPTSAGCRDFPGSCFQKLNSFAAPPFPASSHCLCSLLAVHPAQSCPFSSLQGSHGAGCPEPPHLSPRQTPGTAGHWEAPGRQDWHRGTSQQPQDCGFAQRGQWLRAMSSSRPLEEARRMEGGSRYIPLPRNAQQEEQDNTEIIQNSIFQKNICRFRQLEHFTGEPRRGWDGIPGIPSSIHHQGRATAGLTQPYLQGERAPHEPCPRHLDPSEASASSECPMLAVAAPGALDFCPTPNSSSYFGQFISGWSFLGSDYTRHLKAPCL